MNNNDLNNLSAAINDFISAFANLAEQLAITVCDCIQKTADLAINAFYQYEKAQEKLNCNNWRKNHGLPMIRRAGKYKKCRK